MCGIFFSIGFENLPPSVIDSVAHRGPDGRGWNEFGSPNGSVVMAHRRLAIVDLSQDGHQPMFTEDRRFWVVYNGEIYNYLEIRKELEKLGHYFKTKTDTEVLLKSYLQWGEDCLHHFNGMFSFVIWDDKEKRIFAARDRFGVKPLYYYRQGKKIACASEIKQFKCLPGWKSVLQEEMAVEYLNTGYCDHRYETLYKHVFQVLPGHYIACQLSFDSIELVQWYNLRDKIKPLNIDDNEAIEKFKNLLTDAIRLRLRSDVSVGACLSGGLDSSSIVSMIRTLQDSTKEIHTFSSVFPGEAMDESSYIDELVNQKKLTAHKNYPSFEEFLEKIDLMLYHQDLPFLGTSVFAQWKTFESAKAARVTVLLDGQGADESLLGYPGMLNGIIFDYAKKLNFIGVFKFLRWQSFYNNQSVKNTFLLGLQQRSPYFYLMLLKIKNKKTSFVNNVKMPAIDDVCLWHFLNSLQTLLRYEDRNSMAFSRESRLPFLDYRLVEFILSLSIQQRFRDAKTKWILRESMKGVNLKSILERKDKIGFSAPEDKWVKMLNEDAAFFASKKETLNQAILKRWLKNEKFDISGTFLC